MLNKDKDKRPSIFEIAKIPCVNKKIEQFIQEHNCKEEVMSFFDVDFVKKKETSSKKKGGGKDDLGYIIGNLEYWAEVMHSEIEIKDQPNGWFGKH